MKILLMSLASSLLAMSAEIISWKTPLLKFADHGLNTPGIVRLEKPPEESPFFKEGDEIWDIIAVMQPNIQQRPVPPEWAVWNATSERIVAKGSWAAVLGMHHNMDIGYPPAQCRLKINIYSVAKDGSPPDTTKPPIASFAVIHRSGNEISASYFDKG